MSGYFRHPTVHGSQVVFVSEDDLWIVSKSGGIPRRLTSGLGSIFQPVFSRDGSQIAFSGEEEGHREVYVCDAAGSEVKRLTYLGASAVPVGWDRQGRVLFRSNAYNPHGRDELYVVPATGGVPQPMNLGPVIWAAETESGEVVLERNSGRPDPAHWKRYRGGTAGVLWVGESFAGDFKKLLTIDTNFSRPMWVAGRVHFLSDHEGTGNIYSCRKDGSDLKKHTQQTEFYARNPQTDGKTIVFHAGGALFWLDPGEDQVHEIKIDYRSQRTQRQRKFVSATRHLESYQLSPKGDQLAITARGQTFALKNWEGAAIRYGHQPSVRYRQVDWLFDEKRLVIVSDDGGSERLEIYNQADHQLARAIANLDIGRVTFLSASPKLPLVALSNHRNELIVVDIEKQTMKVADRCEHVHLDQFEWSPDGRMIAYRKSHAVTGSSSIHIYSVTDGRSYAATPEGYFDSAPSWDPDGRFLYFLSARCLDPVYDNVQFELSFPRGVVPCLVTLRTDIASPFLVPPKNDEKVEKSEKAEKSEKMDGADATVKSPTDIPLKVDFEGITERVLAFPVADGRYLQIKGASGKVLWTMAPIKGALKVSWMSSEPVSENRFEVYDFETKKTETLFGGISDFDLSRDRKQMIVRQGRDLRVLKVADKPDEKEGRGTYSKKSGWIDLSRLRVMIEPLHEWKQMLCEVWRLQRDHFWHEGMAKVNWQGVLALYLPLVEKVHSRSEFSDLVWELQGELGTSHAYDIGGDYRRPPHYGLGFLGAHFSYDQNAKGYRIERLIKGDSWNAEETSAFLQPGVNGRVGDVLLAINGETLTASNSPHQVLLHRAADELELTVLHQGETEPRKHLVKTITSESRALYRDWVEKNRRFVHSASQGRVGYIHIPDMGPRGFSEFHRAFLVAYNHDALIVDVRYNGGGHVSQLLLEKLARTPLGVTRSRWFGESTSPEAPLGPLVAITNEHAGSDGDIFSHTFKMRKLGPLIGKRTWGGVVGIWPRHSLADGSITTQPEYAHWFSDVGWDVENYGTDPTIEVEFRPQDYRKGIDPQLGRGVEEALRLLQEKPPFRPRLNPDEVDMRPPVLR